MATWPMRHNWTTPYSVTVSFATTVLVTASGLEQRIADRDEPRRAITTVALDDGDGARTLDRFVWRTQADTFDHVDPVTGYRSTVRFGENLTIDHVTSAVASGTFALDVEPGTDTLAYGEPDALSTFSGRYVFPFPVNWTGGRPDDIGLPRRTADFGRGRIAVTRPVRFASRIGTALLLRVGREETDELAGFFYAMQGRQGEFWTESLLDDLEPLEIVSAVLAVEGGDADAVFRADTVNTGVAITTWSGNVYRRRVLSSAAVGGTTYLQLDQEVPDPVETFRRVSWLRVSRFASDDLTIDWTTSTVAQSQVKTVTLPYAAPEIPLAVDPILDYFGPSFMRVFADLLDYTVNVAAPLIDEQMNRYELAFQFGDPLAYIVNVADPKAETWPAQG